MTQPTIKEKIKDLRNRIPYPDENFDLFMNYFARLICEEMKGQMCINCHDDGKEKSQEILKALE